jgi:hypothetical protein
MDQAAFFGFQRRALSILLGWGVASTVLGALGSLRSRGAARQFWLQTLGWGAIDALIALFGIRGARGKQQQVGVDTVREARRFRTIVAANALLDVGYVAGGAYLVRQPGQRPERRGMGYGIIVQGMFLLVFDSVLWALVQRQIQGK